MLKKVKGIIVQTKDKKILVKTSVFNGNGVDEKIKENIVKGLTNFKFELSSNQKSSDWESYETEITANSSSEIESLKEVLNKRSEITLGKTEEDEVIIVKVETLGKKGDEEFKPTVVDVMSSKQETVKYLGLATLIEKEFKDYTQSSIGLIVSTKKDDDEKIIEFESLGFKALPASEGYEESEWVSFSTWLNKISDEEISLMKELEADENDKHKKRGIISLEISDFGTFKKIDKIVSIEDIPEAVDASEAEDEAIM